MFLIVLNEILLNHLFTYLFITTRLDLLFYFFFIVKRHWAKRKWRYINFVVITIIVIITVPTPNMIVQHSFRLTFRKQRMVNSLLMFI